MNLIQKIIVESFQSHKLTTITPARAAQMTVITGPSDAGKTAIIRALRWLLYNLPQGTDFIRHGASFARVTAEYASGHTVIRERSRRGYNRYIIVPPDGERQVYEGFGNNVPLEVQQITGVSPVTIGDMEFNLNLAEQLDGPFLGKSVSSGARAKVLGKLAGTEEVDYAAKTLGTDLYRKRQERDRLDAEVQELEEKIRAYDYLQHLGDVIAGVGVTLEQLKADIELLDKLKRLVASIQEASELVERKARVLTALTERLAIVEPMLETVDQDANHRDRLVKLQAALTETRAALSRARQTLTDTADADAADGLVAQVEHEHGKRLLFRALAEKRDRNRAAVQQAEAVIQATRNVHLIDTLVKDTWERCGRRIRLTSLGEHMDELQSRLQWVNQVLQMTGQLPGMTELIAQLEQDLELFVKLGPLKDRLKVNSAAARLIQRDLEATAQAKEVAKLITETDAQVNQLIKLINKLSQLDTAKDMARIYAQDRDTAAKHIKMTQQKYIDLLSQHGICPTCGGSVSPERLKEVI